MSTPWCWNPFACVFSALPLVVPLLFENLDCVGVRTKNEGSLLFAQEFDVSERSVSSPDVPVPQVVEQSLDQTGAINQEPFSGAAFFQNMREIVEVFVEQITDVLVSLVAEQSHQEHISERITEQKVDVAFPQAMDGGDRRGRLVQASREAEI